VLNEAYREGRASSLRAGACALRDELDGVLIANVDQPRPRALLRHLLDVQREGAAPITIPTFEGRRGHPTVVAGVLLEELRTVEEESLGLRGLLERHAAEVHEVSVASPLVLLDLNTPEGYERARRDYPKLLGLTGGFGGL
jgi:molybdenum cofactor cytidylyltransferase